MSRRQLTCATLVGMGVFAVALAVYLAITGEHERDATAVARERTTVPLAPPSTGKNPSAIEPSRGSDDPAPDVTPLDDIAYACPDFSVSTELCIASLDRRYLDTAPPNISDGILMPIVEPERPMTLRRAFEDPSGKRKDIEDAWNDPVCKAAWPPIGSSEEWSGTIRRDLATRCQADAMAEFSVLVELCAKHGGYSRHADVHRERAIERLDSTEDNQAYWEKRATFEEGHYRKMWLAEKCRRTGPGTLAPLGKAVYTGDPFMDFLNYLGDVYLLERRAAWLGQEWAMVQYKDSHRPRAEVYEGYLRALREADPIRYHVHEAYRLRGEQAVAAHVLAASRLATSRGTQIDRKALFELAGESGLEEHEARN